MTINEMVVEYKKTKNSQTLNQIFISLSKVIHEKAKYVFYQEKFHASNFAFKLVDTKKIDLEDVVQELNLLALELINKCDIDKPFDKYFYSSIWYWHPRFVNKDFINSLKNCPIFDTDLDGDDANENKLDILRVFPKFEEEIYLDDLFANLTEDERKLLIILQKNPSIKQSELVGIFKVTQPRISQMYDSIRKKYKKN